MPIKYSDSVKRPKSECAYTTEQVIELEKCIQDFFYFCKYVKIRHPDKGRIKYIPRWYQKEFLDEIINNRYFVGLLSRQVGKTISVSVYLLWYALFRDEKIIGIVSNKEKSAKKILAEIKKIYESLPVWLKPGAVEWNVLSVEFDNNSKIMCSATTEDPFRGESINILFCDELAFVRKSIAYSFWSSNFPTLSASETSQLIVISTPNGVYDLFHTIYTGAIKGYNGFAHYKANWRVIEGRDEKWKEEQIKILGKQKFAQEHEIEFLGSTNTVIDAEELQRLLNSYEEPKYIEMEGKLRIYEKPQPGAVYVIGTDCGKGTGEHDSTCQLYKVTNFNPFKAEQVAVWQDNHTDIYTFSKIVHRLAVYYNKAFIMVENNAEGSTVVSQLWWEYEYENLINESQKKTGLGVRATKTTKPKAVLSMKKLIESGDITVVDKKTIDQLTSFIEKRRNIFSGKDLPDDLVSALYWMCFITDDKFDVFEESTKINTEMDEDGWGILADVEIPVEDFSWVHR